jgi:hypothetical protein
VELDHDFNEFVQLLLANDVRFLIIGGYALAAHGVPRYTGDLDTWLWVNGDNADRMLVVLDSFGFGSLNITREDLLNPDSVIQLGYPPHRIDLLTGIDGVGFDDAWNRRVEFEVNGRQVPFISREDLITNKRTVARPQDLVDVSKLEQ